MKAMILAAGLGTRLKPFTDFHPKALFVLNGKTLLEHAVNHLKSAGIEEIIINVHHFADQIIEYIHLNNDFEIKISISDETGELLETGGGLKKAAWFFEDCDTAIVRNVDVISDLDFRDMVAYHHRSGAIATLAVRNRMTSRYFLFDDRMDLCGWENRQTGERNIARKTEPAKGYAFSGIQVLDPGFFPLITEEGRFSLTSLYIKLAAGYKITGYLANDSLWQDVGK